MYKIYKTRNGDFINLDLVNRIFIDYSIIDIEDANKEPLEHFKINFKINFEGADLAIKDEICYESRIETLRSKDDEYVSFKGFKNTNEEQKEQHQKVKELAEYGKKEILEFNLEHNFLENNEKVTDMVNLTRDNFINKLNHQWASIRTRYENQKKNDMAKQGVI